MYMYMNIQSAVHKIYIYMKLLSAYYETILTESDRSVFAPASMSTRAT